MLCCFPGQWSSAWHVFCAAQALKIDIKQIYPFDKTQFEQLTEYRRSMFLFMNSTFKSEKTQGKLFDLI